MIEDVLGRIEYDEQGSGPTLVLVPGSCSTGLAWRPVVKALDGKFRCVTTSLLGYGQTAERRLAKRFTSSAIPSAGRWRCWSRCASAFRSPA